MYTIICKICTGDQLVIWKVNTVKCPAEGDIHSFKRFLVKQYNKYIYQNIIYNIICHIYFWIRIMTIYPCTNITYC